MLRLAIAAVSFLFVITLMIDDSAAEAKHACKGDHLTAKFGTGHGAELRVCGSYDSNHPHCDEDKDEATNLFANEVCTQCGDCWTGTCFDGVLNQNEVDVDCGGVCWDEHHLYCGCLGNWDCEYDQYCNSEGECKDTSNTCGYYWVGDTWTENTTPKQGSNSDSCKKCQEEAGNNWRNEEPYHYNDTHTLLYSDGNKFCNSECDSDENCGICELDNSEKKCVVKGCKSAMHHCCQFKRWKDESCKNDVKEIGGSVEGFLDMCKAYEKNRKALTKLNKC